MTAEYYTEFNVNVSSRIKTLKVLVSYIFKMPEKSIFPYSQNLLIYVSPSFLLKIFIDYSLCLNVILLF